MNSVGRIQAAMHEILARNDTPPTAVYLGSEEYNELKRDCASLLQHACDIAGASVCGLKVHLVAEDNHFRVC